jgi:hypothetical protein
MSSSARGDLDQPGGREPLDRVDAPEHEQAVEGKTGFVILHGGRVELRRRMIADGHKRPSGGEGGGSLAPWNRLAVLGVKTTELLKLK